jgi:ribosomal-protein-alanine N-acetyltransferase
MRTLLRTRLRPMTAADIPQVLDIERESFPSAWPQTAYKRELTNRVARYIVLSELRDESGEPSHAGEAHGLLTSIRRIVSGPQEDESRERILGFIGLWLMVGEAHIVTVAVRESYRRMGIGERLLIAAIELAREYSQEVVTLEVRASNDVAQALYAKYGFARVGLRRRYYTDNDEDAVIMTTPEIASPSYGALFAELRNRHREHYPDLWP